MYDDLGMNLLASDTIAALATPRGSGGVGIIKISGPESLKILERIFRPAGEVPQDRPAFENRRLVYGHIIHPEDGPLDEVLISYMRGPHSYTTEDVVEINCHGGVMVTAAVLDLVLQEGARPAEPGEFTRRAFLGGRINLSQAEAVIDLINAKTRRAVQVGLQQLQNGLDKAIGRLQDQLIEGLAEIEAYIDFDDDMEESFSLRPLADRIVNQIIPQIEKLVRGYRESRIIREGLRIVIAGRPNVGKSSLVNLLLNQDRVIVNPIPGTTRDIIEEMIAIEGAPIVITDTAGIHDSKDPIETIGIDKTKAAIERADLVLFVIDGSRPLVAEDQIIYQSIKDRAHMIVQNKIDLCAQAPVRPKLDGATPDSYVNLSARTGEGLETLRQRVMSCIGLSNDPSGSAVLVNLRQRNLLVAVQSRLHRIDRLFKNAEDTELVAIEIKDCLEDLRAVRGDQAAPDILDQIFERFCIGK